VGEGELENSTKGILLPGPDFAVDYLQYVKNYKCITKTKLNKNIVSDVTSV
jgi:hypothetical protein